MSARLSLGEVRGWGKGPAHVGHRTGDASPAAQLLGPSQLPVHEGAPPPPSCCQPSPILSCCRPSQAPLFLSCPARACLPACRCPLERQGSPPRVPWAVRAALSVAGQGWLRTTWDGALRTPGGILGLGRSLQRGHLVPAQARADGYPCQRSVVTKNHPLERNTSFSQVFRHQQVCVGTWRGDRNSLRLLTSCWRDTARASFHALGKLFFFDQYWHTFSSFHRGGELHIPRITLTLLESFSVQIPSCPRLISLEAGLVFLCFASEGSASKP